MRSRDDTLTLETLDGTGRRVQPITHQQEKEWWRASLRYLISETATPGPGHRAVLARLAESLFLELLQWQLRYVAQGHGGGWLAGLYDAQVGPALTLLHAQPDRSWTVEALAKEVGVSRAALAKRFVELVGESPFSISPAGECTWRSICCKTAHLAWARSRDVLDMTRMLRSIGRSGAWSALRRRHGGKPGRSSLLLRTASSSATVAARLPGHDDWPYAATCSRGW